MRGIGLFLAVLTAVALVMAVAPSDAEAHGRRGRSRGQGRGDRIFVLQDRGRDHCDDFGNDFRRFDFDDRGRTFVTVDRFGRVRVRRF